jgi:2-oxoglutarate dehydrogenase complex dihydrolipoamide succinyltransferase (E2) component
MSPDISFERFWLDQMTVEFKLPDLGEGVAEGEIVKWLVSEGQQIKEDEPMVEVMTDKATVQIPSPATGTVKQILAKEGQTVKVGTNLVILDQAGGRNGGLGEPKVQESARVEQKPVQQDSTPLETDSQKSAHSKLESRQISEPQRILATPATRKLARELSVDIENVHGSGPAGRVTEEDVRNAASKARQMKPLTQSQRFEQTEPAKKLGETRSIPSGIEQAPAREERVPIHGVRKRISDKMIRSSQTTASVTHVDEVDFSALMSMREALKPTAESQRVKLTYLSFIIKAVVATLKQFPNFNASIDEEKQEFVVKRYYNIGIATDTPNGLIVPVIKNADKRNLFEIAREIEKLSEDAKSGKIQLQDIQGGTFTVTNIGTLGGVISTPIINIPEVAILGVHKIQKKPVVRENQIVIRDMAYVALSFDHRIVDGADAARFTTKLRHYLENPGIIFVEESLGNYTSLT